MGINAVSTQSNKFNRDNAYRDRPKVQKCWETVSELTVLAYQ